ncbi:archaeosortase/exosortase family protein [Archangium lansingense]|uniref:Archaeosortase/exosortase family protein n=1 Tax=Archangium lansingense TaxID=2995310 RepID=A0ABT4A1Y4_9BACT|nr:archaeosortase/exosortase family protein [Archangium lansinium]MCY1075658.1 archaeosortase/exosortase family protein [Archangium lansinium]
MGRSYLILLLQLLASWHAWSWYARRVRDGSDEPWGLLALVAMVMLLPRGARHPLRNVELGVLAGVNVALVLAYPWLTPLIRATVCVLCLTAIVSRMTSGRAFHLGTWLLALLSMPVLATVQFYLGYPLRLTAAALAAPMLRSLGLPAVREGVQLVIGSEVILVDVPCSGARMLWVGLFLAVTLACMLRLGAVRTLLACALGLGAILFGNALRVSALTLLERRQVPGPPWLHDGVGVSSFIPVCLLIAAICLWLHGRQRVSEAHG